MVDTASGDGSLGRLQTEDPALQLIANPTNLGLARAAKQAVGAMGWKWLLLLNAYCGIGA